MKHDCELLSPAGDLVRLKTAIRFGADAVYGAMRAYGLRADAGNFTEEELEEGLAAVHAAGKKFYLTLNIFPYDDDMDGFVRTARTAREMGVDAALVSDIGAFLTLREKVPELKLHISTQANTLNSAAARFYYEHGAERIVLAREMSLDRIRAMRRNLPEELVLEAFAHGAMCISYSGRCLLSAYQDGRSANRGACSQPCRLPCEVKNSKGEFVQEEDARGTYILSSYDLCMLDRLPDMLDAGVGSLKIEGRMKTEYYVAAVTQAYRRALDLAMNDTAAYEREAPVLLSQLDKASHRPFNTGFFYGAPAPAAGAPGTTQTMEYAGRVLGRQGERALIEVRGKLTSGMYAEFLTPGGVWPVTLSSFRREDTGETLDCAKVPGMRVTTQCPLGVEEGDMLRIIDVNHRGS